MALYAEAMGRGRWVSYSRAKTHYEAPERYRSPLYTYRKVRGSVDQLEALGLIDHQKALPGDRGWQSAMIARPELIRLVQKVTAGQLALAPLHEPIRLRDAEKNLIDYRDTGLTERMRREVQAQNEVLAATGFGEILPFPGRSKAERPPSGVLASVTSAWISWPQAGFEQVCEEQAGFTSAKVMP